jgi:hypothetical protein
MAEQKIAYEPHPVSAERKAELIALGFKILDERFKPEEPEEAPKPVRAERQATRAE